MYNKRKCIDFFFIDKNVKLHKLTALITTQLIIKRGISSGSGFQRIKEIINNLIQRKFIFQKRTCFFHIFHTFILSTAFLTEIHDRTDKFCRYHDLSIYHRLFHIFNLGWIRKIRRIRQLDNISVCLVYLVDYTRRCRYKVKIIFSFQTFLNDFKMKQPKETTAETKSKSNRCLRLKKQ